MPSFAIHQASGSEGDPQLAIDEKKRKRMLSNRESARRSRMRKQQHLDDLVKQVSQLKDQNSKIQMQVNLLSQQYMTVESENSILRAQLNALSERLKLLNLMHRIMEENSGISMDIPEIPDHLLRSWQIPCTIHHIMKNADMFQV